MKTLTANGGWRKANNIQKIVFPRFNNNNSENKEFRTEYGLALNQKGDFSSCC